MSELHDIDICDNYNIDSMHDTRGKLDNNCEVGLVCHLMHTNKKRSNFRFELWSYSKAMFLKCKNSIIIKAHPP